MRRRLANTVCLLSLLLAVAVAALWARSVAWASDMIEARLSYSGRLYAIESNAEDLTIYAVGSIKPRPPTVRFQSDEPYTDAGVWGPLIPSVHHDPKGLIIYAGHLQLVALLFIPPVAWQLVGRRAGQPIRACSRCGYDLRGSSGGACPECGEATAAGRTS